MFAFRIVFVMFRLEYKVLLLLLFSFKYLSISEKSNSSSTFFEMGDGFY